jgi:hypothetical protein
VGHYRTVTAQDVWPGIDVQYRIAAQGVETVYHVHPSADASLIQLRYEGQDGAITVDANGSLLLSTSLGTVKEQAPFAYQNINHAQIEIPCRYELTAEGGYHFVLGSYDMTREVVIDPLVYCSYWGGGSLDEVYAIGEDPQHHKLVAVYLYFGNDGYPITPGAYQTIAGEYGVGALSKFNAAGDSLLFSTFLGGVEQWSYCVIGDAQGSVYVAGDADLSYGGSVPLTADAFDTTAVGLGEGFFSRFSADGTSLEFSSYIGGSDRDYVRDLAMDSTGDVYLCGNASPTGFPVTPDALYPQGLGGGNGFLAVFDPRSSTLRYSTLFPAGPDGSASASGLTLGNNRRVWLCGNSWHGGIPITDNAFQGELVGDQDAFVALIDLQADSLVYSSYLGGSSPSYGNELACRVLPLGGDTIIVGGMTSCADFPFTSDAFDTVAPVSDHPKIFLTMLALPNTLVRSTFLGGDWTTPHGFALDRHGSVLVAGRPEDANFPVTPDAEVRSFREISVSRMSRDLRRLEYSTFLGGSNHTRPCGFLWEPGRGVWLCGVTKSNDLPTTPNALIRQYPWPGDDEEYGFILCYALPGDTIPDNARRSVSPYPLALSLSCFPNPFNSTVMLTYELPTSGHVEVKVFDLLGREVAVLHDGMTEAGAHSVRWDAQGMASGIYFVTLRSARQTQTQKIMLLK